MGINIITTITHQEVIQDKIKTPTISGLNRIYIKANDIKQEQDRHEQDHERDQTTETPSKTDELINSKGLVFLLNFLHKLLIQHN